MFCSTVIATVGRPTLTRAVVSVLQQAVTSNDFEVIVVNDSGESLPESEWQHSERVRVVNTDRHERSVARNTGAAMARGRYLHFLDDDDWMAPGAFHHLWAQARTGVAALVYGHTQLVDRQGEPLLQLRHGLSGNCFVQAMAGEWIPLQASLVDADVFFDVGGFNPLLVGPEDVDLVRRIALRGDLAETPEVVAYVSWGQEGSTTDYEHHSQASRWAREMILDSAGAFARMRNSARSSYWHGRISRAYLTSAVWNLKHGRRLPAVNRLVFGLTGLVMAGTRSLSSRLWQAVLEPYSSETFARGHQKTGGLRS